MVDLQPTADEPLAALTLIAKCYKALQGWALRTNPSILYRTPASTPRDDARTANDPLALPFFSVPSRTHLLKAIAVYQK